jgi:ubiquinone/menaquinone biosynthesis C-methylase UbiE
MNQINSVQTVLEQARHLSEAGEVERAGQLLEQALQENPSSSELLSHLAHYYFQTRRHARAYQYLHEFIKLSPPDTGHCLMLAQIHEARKEYPDAVFWLRRILEKEPENQEVKEHYRKLKRKILRATLRDCVRLFLRPSMIQRGIRTVIRTVNHALIYLLELLLPLLVKPQAGEHPFSLVKYLRFATRYDPDYRKSSIAYHKIREILLASRNLPLQKGITLLDIGTGKNSIPLYWAKFGVDITCIDGSTYGFQELRESRDVLLSEGDITVCNFVVGDARHLPFSDDYFDAITSLCVIEHIPHDGDLAVMREIYRVLKPGGRAVITVESARIFSEKWLEVPYSVGYQLESGQSTGSFPATRWEEVFCRDYSPQAVRERLIASAPWKVIRQGFYDDTLLPIRSWLHPSRRTIFSVLVHLFQPLLSLIFYRPQEEEHLTPSSIAWIILEK